MKINFQEVKLYGEKSCKCAGGCGRRLRRQKKFYQTLNPFNKKNDGNEWTVKDRDDIYNELIAEMRQWESGIESCCHCKAKSGQ